MAENSSYITGPSRPIAGIPSTYRLNIHCETVRWEVRLNLSVLISNTTGVFTFHTASLDKTFIVQAHFTLKSSPGSVFSASLAVKPLPGVPEFTKMSWQDTHLEDIGSRRVEYLDDVYLSVRTENIPPGDRLMAKIIEKETLQEDRPAGRALYAEVDESGTARFKVSSELLKRFAEKWNAQDWINETTHQYYAEISYYGERIPDENQAIIYPSGSPPPRKGPIVRKTEKSAVLEITNVAGQAIPPNNGAKPVVALEDKNRYKKLNPVKLKVNLFFDGTKNNRENALLREKGSNRSKEEEKIYRKHGGKESDDNSYQQGYSNVALLQWSDAAKKKQKEISIYIEGIGTEDGEGDSWRGMGFDYGPTNIKAKAGKTT